MGIYDVLDHEEGAMKFGHVMFEELPPHFCETK